jgi:outer membrane protein OmpA-like peptidoglycan-associated protein
MDKLLDNNFGTNIGGKLIYSNPREKKFFANKTVYLCNRLNTVVKKTQTNLFGTFVFEDIKPDNMYFIGVDRSEISSGTKIDLLNKEDRYVTSLDSLIAGRMSFRLLTAPNKAFNDISIAENEMKMDVKATIFGDNVNNPIGKLKILLLNDRYEVIDSAVTDNFGTFKFKYLPFLKRFYLSADNTDNVLDVFKNILIYSSDANLIKIMTHQKGNKFNYNPVSAELNRLRDIEMEDPWLQLVGPDLGSPSEKESLKSDLVINEKNGPKLIVENILFEANNSKITPQAREVLDKVVLVLARNQALCIEVGAHTDSKGLAATNLKLSDERAKVVRQYIVNAGIKSERISARGYGESKLLNQCDDQHDCTEKEHAQNRRIEFKILDNPEAHQK